ncbi:ThuA domain-containing protein [Cellulomonas sp. APG4]|uniref:ThuA domain-containing protein n=1 Tax=Cellulomonas sp. APG4 TaxID=1538656 RepID=UPI0013793C1E|nr:ThuA domain-containing protein [Cellulomonas sp. APG4]NCT91457.1 ThuA domain-containing protein [Cellulomonas sp. APG4]
MSRALVFTRTTDYRHESIEHGTAVVRRLLADDGVASDHTEEPAAFHATSLSRYDLVVWLSTTGDVLDDDGRRALASWLAGGGAWAGVHGATVAEPGWPEFERIAGAVFTDHPEIQPARVRVADASHPSTSQLPVTWEHTDEWYNFRRRPGPEQTVLLTVDEATYAGGTMGADHPVAWHGGYGAGRTWYTSLGHAAETFDDPTFVAHLRGGLRSLLA